MDLTLLSLSITVFEFAFEFSLSLSLTHTHTHTHHTKKEKKNQKAYLDVLKFKHVAMDKGLLDLLTGPCDEQLVVVVGLQPKENLG